MKVNINHSNWHKFCQKWEVTEWSKLGEIKKTKLIGTVEHTADIELYKIYDGKYQYSTMSTSAIGKEFEVTK